MIQGITTKTALCGTMTREELETQLREVTQLFTLITENNPFAYFWKDLDLVYRGCNQRFATIAGFATPDEVVGKTDREMPWGINDELGAQICRQSDMAVINSGKEAMRLLEQINQDTRQVCWSEASKVPIRDPNGKIIGVLGVMQDVSARKIAEIRLEEANKKLEELVRLDPLTHVSNRRHFTEICEREWARATREQKPIAVILFDIDDFKHFNDTLGHQAGDDCLEKVAQSASATLGRPSDFIARFGGEEFIVLLPSTSLAGATALADEIRQNIQQIALHHKGNSTRVTISAGVACTHNTATTTSAQLISRADKALYRAKNRGKNCVIAAPDYRAASPEQNPA
ncbi:MAG TPA: GGDEF domain-containing protein [Marinagarivorans sp.]